MIQESIQNLNQNDHGDTLMIASSKAISSLNQTLGFFEGDLPSKNSRRNILDKKEMSKIISK